MGNTDTKWVNNPRGFTVTRNGVDTQYYSEARSVVLYPTPDETPHYDAVLDRHALEHGCEIVVLLDASNEQLDAVYSHDYAMLGISEGTVYPEPVDLDTLFRWRHPKLLDYARHLGVAGTEGMDDNMLMNHIVWAQNAAAKNPPLTSDD